jgi:P4 family phage/plasmid primase-like protien
MTDLSSLPDELDGNIYFEDKKFKGPMLAQDIIFQFADINDRLSGINRGFLITKENKKIWRYNDGYYEQDGEEIIRDLIQKILKNSSGTHYKNEVVEWIKDNQNIQVSMDIFDSQPNKINLQNGTYDIKTKEFSEHCQSDFFNYCLPILYNKEAKIEKIQKFMEDTFYLEDIPVIQELIGYCLFKEYFIHKAFLFVGEGRNGKTTLLNLITNFLGVENVASISLHSICKDRFGSYDLYGKLANLWDDLSSDLVYNTGLFKIATGGGYLRAERKFEQSFKFINKAKFIFSCNIIPESKDNSMAYAKRWIVIEFPNTFEGTNCNKMIGKELASENELSGLFNWAIEGLDRLLTNQDFSKHRTLEDVIKFRSETQSPVFKFVEKHIDTVPESEIPKEEVYRQFIKFCQTDGYPTLASNVFSSKFKQYGPFSMEEGQSRLMGMKKTWKGIKFKNLGQQEGDLFTYTNVNDVNDV